MINENIYLDIDYDKDNNNYDKNLSYEITEMLNELENKNTKNNHNHDIAKLVDYTLNYKIKDLYLICDYYGILKEVKQNKFNKEQIINIIINFENDVNNSEIVYTRLNMWFYINELKNDKFMKKFILF